MYFASRDQLLTALDTRGVPVHGGEKRWELVQLMLEWAGAHSPSEEQAAAASEAAWPIEVEDLGG